MFGIKKIVNKNSQTVGLRFLKERMSQQPLPFDKVKKNRTYFFTPVRTEEPKKFPTEKYLRSLKKLIKNYSGSPAYIISKTTLFISCYKTLEEKLGFDNKTNLFDMIFSKFPKGVMGLEEMPKIMDKICVDILNEISDSNGNKMDISLTS